MIQTPDPFIPGRMITVQDPEVIVNQQGHDHCPICNGLRDRLASRAEFNKAFNLVDPDSTVPFNG